MDSGVPKVGILGSLVWDLIYGRDPASAPVEEWGGIAYALAGLDASVAPGWEIVPLIKVGQDLAGKAQEFLARTRHLAPGGRCVEVPAPNNRVVLHYYSSERRTERMSGGVPGWTWTELGPMVRGPRCASTSTSSPASSWRWAPRRRCARASDGPIYVDLHSLLLGMQHDGVRVARPLPEAATWLGCFDVVQLNEDEMRQLSPDPLSLAAEAIGAGRVAARRDAGGEGRGVCRGAGVRWLGGRAVRRSALGSREPSPPSRPERRPAARHPPDRPHPGAGIDVLDPTGCGDVFGAAAAARLLRGRSGGRRPCGTPTRWPRGTPPFAAPAGSRAHLRGELVTP